MSQQLTHPLPRLLLPAALAASLALTGCGAQGSGPSMEELEARIAPTADASAPAADPSALAELRFDTESLACDPRIHADAQGAWETSAPRTEVSQGAPLKLRNTEGSEGTDVPVDITVTTPGGKTHQAEATLSGGEWIELSYPADFSGASLAAGAFTVVWTTGEGAFIACDGFRGA
ncbi:hypothetical protein [Streptomonospora litoralis]|uniref:hypothetical protein n=1 Tax=Streptomonospora litoralis TaxID=2498135 RepID=UPI00103571B5|nr:hypothetical protein [Streptomonospora litoralis]